MSFHILDTIYQNTAMKIVIASEAKQSHHCKEIATHLSDARNDSYINRLNCISHDLGYNIYAAKLIDYLYCKEIR